MARKVPTQLASARAYWRLAVKFERAGNYKQGEHYRNVGDRFYRRYQRDKEYHEQTRQAASR